ncbi:MAG: response regulator transcription factor [Gallionellaceae bacterium]|nr:MAG: response regulator transcription factor [Gallionellaceae bacterium]
MIRLMIADDHAVVRNGIKQILTLASDIVLVAEAVDGTVVLHQAREGGIDLLLLDMNMPGISGVDLIGRVKLCRPELPILIFTMHNDAQLAMRALKAGASGFICKDSEPEMLLAAIRKVSAGGKYLDPAVAEQIAFDATSTNLKPPHTLLSDRELEIFRLLVAGKSGNEIAEKLCISNKTISTHKTHLMEKMNLHNVADLVRYAVQYGLTD